MIPQYYSIHTAERGLFLNITVYIQRREDYSSILQYMYIQRREDYSSILQCTYRGERMISQYHSIHTAERG